MTSHLHEWSTFYKTINGVDCASGMICECGEKLTQDEVEQYVNEYQVCIKNVEDHLLRGIEDAEPPKGVINAV